MFSAVDEDGGDKSGGYRDITVRKKFPEKGVFKEG